MNSELFSHKVKKFPVAIWIPMLFNFKGWGEA